ncbi:hypothetical protein TNCV_4587121 [Trichonephila clavipes]|nr:hypothetical protein TNCV_4587121 [Trichonephila clavipes]
MLRLGKTRPLPVHSIFGSIGARKDFILVCLHPPRSPTRKAVCRSSGKYQARRLPGLHPEYNATASDNVSSRTSKRGITSRLTGAGSLLPPVYSEAWAKGISRTPFSSLRDAAHDKHAGQKTNVVSQKEIK